jgi:hypothetical protein
VTVCSKIRIYSSAVTNPGRWTSKCKCYPHEMCDECMPKHNCFWSRVIATLAQWCTFLGKAVCMAHRPGMYGHLNLSTFTKEDQGRPIT